MNKILAAVAALSILATPAFAETVYVDGLTAEQKAAVEAQIAQTKAENVSGKSTSAAQAVNEWVEVGKGLGSGLAAGAKEMGVVVNDFAKTDVGKFTMFVIFFKVMGSTLIHLAAGVLWFTVMGALWFYFYKKLWEPSEVEIKYNEAGKKISKTIIREPLDSNKYGSDRLDSYRFLGIVFGAIIAVAGFVITFTG